MSDCWASQNDWELIITKEFCNMGGRAEKETRRRKLITEWTLSGAYQYNDYEFVKLKYPRPRREKYSKMGREISLRGGLRMESDLSFSDYHFHCFSCTDFKKKAKDFLSLYWVPGTRGFAWLIATFQDRAPHTKYSAQYLEGGQAPPWQIPIAVCTLSTKPQHQTLRHPCSWKGKSKVVKGR